MTLTFDADGNLLSLHLSGEPEYAPYPLPDVWRAQLDGYFAGRLKTFAAPVFFSGTPYQQKIWREVAQIPFGQILTYQDIARLSSSHPRAVGGACRSNPLSLIVPTHRVVSKHGIGGVPNQNSRALEVKRWLLRHEGVEI
ncbi:methylated-DNA--[protein]-cysteine S-methyltransferase [Neisseria perflava]|uniref:methylated-DNA--[protein]-cysteine S-methyltransferase n=1 Tax=Neisseria perflava TaxID=33053 RepID=UPI0020A04CA7|nr:methylated-DNA--[protein]-cysteine S-methyltransferase [Neisseria perflava]MCP1660474.1 methylated-DNA-[protein]-cysteine S-methyltransferase [Neisseria perflava]MCP1772023.1 methylated-DNA-[protein]-cysteine S-methyltransferase [Neisseria perflava]